VLCSVTTRIGFAIIAGLQNKRRKEHNKKGSQRCAVNHMHARAAAAAVCVCVCDSVCVCVTVCVCVCVCVRARALVRQ
jgi:hypothetical protein